MFEILVLANLMLKPCYGYEFKRHQKVLNPNNNKIYPLLKKFTDEGLVTVRSETQSDRPARKVYEITDAGGTLRSKNIIMALANHVLRANVRTCQASDADLTVDHIHALWILPDRFHRTHVRALSALSADPDL